VAVWEDHLLPMLRTRDAARLGTTCKALRELVREHFRDLGSIRFGRLREALTTFPGARSMARNRRQELEHLGEAQIASLVAWLGAGAGGHGGGITTVTTTTYCNHVNELIHTALRRGALPSLRSVAANLVHEAHQDLLTEELLIAMHELRLKVHWSYELEGQLAALGLVRQLPALTKLELKVSDGDDDDDDDDDDDPVEWPPFISPSLTALRINLICVQQGAIVENFLHALPGMLGASGARLERLEIQPHNDFTRMGDGLSSVAQALRCCSPTLKDFRLLSDCNHISIDDEAEDHASQVERLRVQWADVMAGVSACRELQVLKLPKSIEVEPLFPPGTAFARLVHLQIGDHERQHPPDAGAMGLWELMASRGLPALAQLNVSLADLRGQTGVEEVKTRVAPALAVVAGTLTRLDLRVPAVGSDEVDVLYEVGVAVGKLRQLKDLTLMLSGDGRAYHAVVQGLAASGGDRVLPLLWRVDVFMTVSSNVDLLASLLLQSVRVFMSCHEDDQSALLMACALRQAGYKHTWALMVFNRGDGRDLVRGIPRCSLGQHWNLRYPEAD
jgi:hypothetical protein